MKNLKNLKRSLLLIILISFASFDILAQNENKESYEYKRVAGVWGWYLTCTQCNDGIDNNGNVVFDCSDPDCLADCPVQAPALCENQCDDGIDNDGDGLIDGCDSDCPNTCFNYINKYWKVINIAGTTCTSCSDPTCNDVVFTLGSGYGLATTIPNDFKTTAGVQGNRVLIIQMQAATATVDGVAAGVIDRTVTSSSYGNVSNYGSAGNYEFADIATISGSDITFVNPLVNRYNVTGKVQIIPVYGYGTGSFALNTTTVPMPYNSTLGVGGVLVMESSGTITLNANISANFRGFQRGDTIGNGFTGTHVTTVCCNTAAHANYRDKWAYELNFSHDRGAGCGTAVGIIYGARKGSGIFGVASGHELSKGKNANGGGGAHGYNPGGGGGGGYEAGGNGGYEHAFGCGTTLPAVDQGGRGGLGLQGGTTALFMGGGGGAGHGNNNSELTLSSAYDGYPSGTKFRYAGFGGNGGGIVIVKAQQITAAGGTRTISANGERGWMGKQDGGGGGGGAGSVILEVGTYSGTLNINAFGGNGGSTHHGTGGSDCHGPGGGGGGGRVVLSVGGTPAGVTINRSSGAAGIVLNNNPPVPNTSFCNHTTNYGAVAGVTGNTTFNTTINTQVCTTTPVTLINFYAELMNDNAVRVSWNTTTEINASNFVVERSSDGINFGAIGTVQAKGNSQQALSYSFIDEEASTFSGTVYYRLRMVDLDATFEYSTIASVLLKGAVISIFPNPVKEGGVNVVYYSYVENEEISVSIGNILGQLYHSLTTNLVKGNNEIHLSTQGLSAGIYFVEVNSKYGKTVEKIIIE